MQEVSDYPERPPEDVDAHAAQEPSFPDPSPPIAQAVSSAILIHSGFDEETTNVKDPKGEPGPALTTVVSQNGALQEPDLVARMHTKRAEFAQFRTQFAQFRRGYNGRLYEFLQFDYEMDQAFRLNLNEMSRFSEDEFFGCNRQKPDETNLLRHNLYFLSDARTDPDRDKWIRPAAVLEYFRTQGVPGNEVAHCLKTGGGFSRIYKSIPGDQSSSDASCDEHDIFREDSDLVVADQCSNCEYDVVAADEFPRFPDANLDETRAAGLTQLPDRCDDTTARPCAPAENDNIANSPSAAAVATDYRDKVSGQVQSGTVPKRLPLTEADRVDKVVIYIPSDLPHSRFPAFSLETVTRARRGVIFFEGKPSGRDDWNNLTAVGAWAIDDDSMPWPQLVDPRTAIERADQNESRVCNDKSDFEQTSRQLPAASEPVALRPSIAAGGDKEDRAVVAKEQAKVITSAKSHPLSTSAGAVFTRPNAAAKSEVTTTKVTSSSPRLAEQISSKSRMLVTAVESSPRVKKDAVVVTKVVTAVPSKGPKT